MERNETQATFEDHAENLRNIAGFLRIQGDIQFSGEIADAADALEAKDAEIERLRAIEERAKSWTETASGVVYGAAFQILTGKYPYGC